MQVVNLADIRTLRRRLSGSLGFVPTMGYLHEGHLTLVRRARAENDVVVVSIYVNPAQFGRNEDLDSYPRDLGRDLRLLEDEGVDIVFAPSDAEMYPPGFSSWVDVEVVTECLEGACRPGHFRGVSTVVAKLLNAVQPSMTYFGQKDAQQVVVIQRMVADLNMDLEVVVVPTVREHDGLAMSSRNVYLSRDEREAATVLFRALSLARKLWEEGERDGDRIRDEMTTMIQEEPLARIDYVSVADARTLEELRSLDGPALASMAVRIGGTRLIDNVALA